MAIAICVPAGNVIVEAFTPWRYSFQGEATAAAATTVDGSAIAAIALEWEGREFNPGVMAQCAYFVREVLEQAGVTLTPEITKEPLDNHQPGIGMANGFGADQGDVITDKSQLRPGDIVMFANTYGNWEPGTITHVGIAVGNEMMVDRPTASRPVQHRPIDTFPNFAGAIRLRGQAIATNNQSSIDTSLSFVLKWEGGDSDHPSDFGGATRKGITEGALRQYGSQAGVVVQNPMFLTDEEVNRIYQAIWDDSQCGTYAEPFATACFDTAVNFGVPGMNEFLQELIVNPHDDPKGAAIALAEARIAYRHQRVAEEPSQEDFLQGWLNRDNDLKRLIEESDVSTTTVQPQPQQSSPSVTSEQAMAYFQEIANGSEFGEAAGILRWKQDVIRFQILGEPTQKDITTLQQVQGELTALTGIQFEQSDAPDMLIRFVPEAEMAAVEPNYVEDNKGFFWLQHEGGAITNANILISATGVTQQERDHLIREEVTQAMGLRRDSHQYEDSIFHSSWRTTATVQDYSAIDEEIIRMLYAN
ncbi:MAG: DUF2927 domain-containing protein [Cyanobacteria bacterium J06638_22]